MAPGRLAALLQRFRRARVLVVGDLMFDEFVWGKVSRISPEAPVPVVWVQRESVMPGGAANVASNIRALGGQVRLAGVVGTDQWGEGLLRELAARRIDTTGVIRDASRPTTVKTRVIAHHQQVVRVDREYPGPLTPAAISRLVELIQRQLDDVLTPAAIRRLVELIQRQLDDVEAIVIEDYGKGVITRALLERVVPLARARKKVVTVDPKEDHFELYQGVTALTPNRAEAGEALGRELATEDAVLRGGTELLRRLRSEALLITLGEDGMCLFEHGGRRTWIPTVAQEVFDVAGAGDTVIGAFTLALAAGCSMPEAAVVANHAAGIVVGKVGVATATPKELLARLDQKPRTLKAQGSRLKANTSSLQPSASSRGR
ncbi:MAG: bifunctional hydroxymethylpyrimidine kinase/phosphomethylpyrimidine kinase [Candidatus Omnitrophica bacterium]|nr:bifunctional hydroxymethylpyrimidine kinase/phosphomethylpyrimidine kinase [Candidatus Omnitrophota bacterium]